MSTSTTDEQADAEVIDLEPTMHLTGRALGHAGPSRRIRPEAGDGRGGGEPRQPRAARPGSLLRSRLAAASLLLAVAYAILLVWHVGRWGSARALSLVSC